jgi:hypothetical protein
MSDEMENDRRDDEDVEAHHWRRHEPSEEPKAEATGDDDETPDVEAHQWRRHDPSEGHRRF